VKSKSQKYKDNYHDAFPCITKSPKGEYYARCNICSVDISVSHGGLNDCKQHIKTGKHQENVSLLQPPSIKQYFTNDLNIGVINAECLMSSYLVEHNMPLSSSDHFTSIVKQMFPDSKIAAQFSCKRTKTSCVVQSLADDEHKKLIEKLSDNVFSLCIDGSNDRGDQQLYPVVLKYYDEGYGRIVTNLLSLPKMTEISSTGKNIFDLISVELQKNKLSWKKCIAFSVDNANVMMGKGKGAAAFVLKENADIFIMGCNCHLAHLAASKASKKLNVDVSQLLIDIYYYLDKSSQRQKLLLELQKELNTEDHSILKHCATRWLSLTPCIQRLLEQWSPVTEFFKVESTKHSRQKRPN
jgi:hypothetical protein